MTQRFTLRELLLVTTIVALLIPYYLDSVRAKRSRSGPSIDSNLLADSITELWPGARIGGSRSGGNHGDYTVYIPEEQSDGALKRIGDEIEAEIYKQGWKRKGGRGYSTLDLELRSMEQSYIRDGYLARIGLYLISEKPYTKVSFDEPPKLYREIRFVFISNTITDD